MPGEVIDRPNPPALPSHLPDNVLDLAVKLERKPLDEDVAKSLKDFQSAACYIAAGMPHPQHRRIALAMILMRLSHDFPERQRASRGGAAVRPHQT
jgi:hypothetical protein